MNRSKNPAIRVQQALTKMAKFKEERDRPKNPYAQLLSARGLMARRLKKEQALAQAQPEPAPKPQD